MKNAALLAELQEEIINTTHLPKKESAEQLLDKLINQIGEVDFVGIAYPQITEIERELEHLKTIVFNDNGAYNKENDKEVKRYQLLQKKLASCKVNKTHYLVIVIEQLLKKAKQNNWQLAKRNGIIYLYNSFYWQEIEKELLQHFLGRVALKMGVDKYKGKVHTFKDELYKQFLSDSYLPSPSITGATLINLGNGTYEVGIKRELREHNPKDFLTYQLPFDYTPEADSPLFRKYLNEVLPDTEKQLILAEYCGYIFTKASNLKLEKVLILFGGGANGKSVFFEIINALLGIDNVSNFNLNSLTSDNGYYRAKIGNKLLNYASEINGRLESDIFKQLVSGEPLEARLPYQDPFILRDYAKLIFNCNTLPKEVEQTNAFFRRFLIIHFDQTIPESKQDKQLSKKIIENELAGVFNWVLQGLERLLKQKNFTYCQAVDKARSIYEQESDSVKQYLSEYQYVPSTSETTSVKTMYEQYKNLCHEDGFRPVNKMNFKKRLANSKIYCKRASSGYVAEAIIKSKENGEIDF